MMRKIEVRLTGKTWGDLEAHVCHAVQLTSNGDLVFMGTDTSREIGQSGDGQALFATKLQHGYSAGVWAEFRDAGEVQGMGPGEKAN